MASKPTKSFNWQIRFNKRGGPLDDTETRDNVDIEAPVNRRERRAIAAWKRKRARQGGPDA